MAPPRGPPPRPAPPRGPPPPPRGAPPATIKAPQRTEEEEVEDLEAATGSHRQASSGAGVIAAQPASKLISLTGDEDEDDDKGDVAASDTKRTSDPARVRPGDTGPMLGGSPLVSEDDDGAGEDDDDDDDDDRKAPSSAGGKRADSDQDDADEDFAGGRMPQLPPRPPPPPALSSAASASGGDTTAAAAAAAAGERGRGAADFEPDEDELAQGPDRFRAVRMGRLVLTLVGGDGLYKPDHRGQALKIDPYIKFELGRGSARPLRAKTKPAKNSGPAPDFGEEVVELDMLDPMALLVDDSLVLHYEVWDANMFSDTKLGEGAVSILRFFEYTDGARQHWFPLTLQPKAKRGGQLPPPEPAGRLLLGLQFQPARPGVLVVTLMEGINLRNMDLFGEQDPYVLLEHAKVTRKGQTITKGGRNPAFGDEQLELVVSRDNWTQPLRVACFDEDPGRDDFIGDTQLPIIGFTALDEPVERTVALLASGKDAGQLRLGFSFYPAGSLTIEVAEARKLASTDAVGQMDPYVRLTVGGSAHPIVGRTKTDTDGGTDPVWNERLVFDVVDHHELRIEVFDADLIGKDDVIGAVTTSLLPVFKKGFRDHWFPLKRRTTWGALESRGEVRLVIEFDGPPGLAFPQRQPDMDRFDDSERLTKSGERVVDVRAREAAARAARARGAAAAQAAAGAGASGGPAEFSDPELEDAFQFLDLDGNLYLSAAELRHVLICMGELITDEEIDEMVRMVDADGDGQVSFDEFRRLALHPDPASADFDLLVRGAAEEEEEDDDAGQATGRAGDAGAAGSAAMRSRKPPPPPSAQGLDLSEANLTAMRAKDAQVKAERKKYLRIFVEENSLRLPDLQKAYERYKALPSASSSAGYVGFQDMCDVFGAEPTGEARQLYNVFVDADAARVPIKQLLLALSAFVGANRNQRINFCFFLFDEDRSGTIDESELREILRANHLASDATQVERKAQVILRQADKDGNGLIDMEEFVVIAAKLPNILFPTFDE